MSFNAFRENKILAKISESTVYKRFQFIANYTTYILQNSRIPEFVTFTMCVALV